MKVFFSSSPRGLDKYGNYYKAIFSEMQKMGFTVVDTDIVSIEYKDFLTNMESGQEAVVDYAKKKMNGIHESDICVFEATVPSLGVGFMVQKALELGKPTIVLYFRENIPLIISGIEDEKLIVKSYDEKSLKKVLNTALTNAKERRDKRFNFFISPKLLDYLERVSKEDGITKSKFIRNLILEHMRKSTV